MIWHSIFFKWQYYFKGITILKCSFAWICQTGDSKDVVELTDGNFEELVLRSKDLWLVEFFAPWCGHCKNLAPHWTQAATELKGKVKLGALDATVHTIMAGRYGVCCFEWVRLVGLNFAEKYR